MLNKPTPALRCRISNVLEHKRGTDDAVQIVCAHRCCVSVFLNDGDSDRTQYISEANHVILNWAQIAVHYAHAVYMDIMHQHIIESE